MDTEPISKSCPRCQSPLPADAPQGLCPKCLLAAVATPTEASQPAGRPAPPPIGEIAAAFPQLEILELIGQGGMGFVFKARQPKLDRLVALKILPQSLAADPTFAERFNREAKLLARLNHPGIVTVHDFGVAVAAGILPAVEPGVPPGGKGVEVSGTLPDSKAITSSTGDPGGKMPHSTSGQRPDATRFYYLLMEFVDGVNLRQAMQAGRFTPEQALAIVPKICEALQFAHNEGILHRDIKPENILLDAKGRVKIADFGIAKLMGNDGRADLLVSQAAQQHRPTEANLTEAGKTLGSPNYMAPEQLDHPGEVDHRADIYSLGVVFYEMLTGELPRGRFAPPSQKSTADPRVDEVVLRALEKEKTRRYASADEVRTQVETITGTPDSGRRRGDESQTEKQSANKDQSQSLLTSSPTMLKSESARLAVQEFSSAGMNFPTMGEVALHMDRLVISSGHYKRSIPLMDIDGLGEAVMPFWESPGPHRYVAVDFNEAGQCRRLVFLAGSSMFRSPGDTRLHAAEWLTAIQRAMKSGIGRDVPIADVPTVAPVLTWRTFSWLLTPIFAAMPLLANYLTYRGPESLSMTNAALISGALMLVPVVTLFVVFVVRSVSLRGTVKRPLGCTMGGAGVPSADSRSSRREEAQTENEERRTSFWWTLTAVSAFTFLVLYAAFMGFKVHHRLSGIDNIVANPLDHASARQLNGPPFVARLNQAEVELVAVGNQPWTNTVCWLANGALSDKPFPFGGGSMGQWSQGKVTKKIAFRIHNESSEEFSFPVGRDTNDPEVRVASSNLQWPTRHGDASFIQLITCPTNAQTMNFSLGLANGKWETAITLKHDNGLGASSSFASETEGEWSATYTAVVGRGDVAINCNYTKATNWSSRMVAVAEDGKMTVIPENLSSVSALQTGGILLVSSNEFAHIKEFRLQRRKYQWVEFRNVSLQPGHRTTVEVVENLVKPVATIAPSSGSADAAPIFDEVIEQVVTNAFNFATRAQSRVVWADGRRLAVSPGQDKEKFLREHDIDLFTDDDLGLYGIDIKVMRAEWNPQTTYEQIAGQLQSSNSYTLYGLNGLNFKSPGTMPAYWFETRTGLKGILQITGFSDNPRGVKMRYKLVQNDSAPKISAFEKTIMITRATNQLVGSTSNHWTVDVWSYSTLLPGEKFREVTRRPDGETVSKDASFFSTTKSGKYDTSTSFTWWFEEEDGFGAAEAEAAAAQIREHWTQKPTVFRASEPREVFCVTNGRGATLAGSIEYVRTAPQPPDASGQVKATVQIKHFRDSVSIPSIGFQAKVPAGYALRATSNYGEGHINSPAGPYDYDATWFPMNYGLRQPAVTALSWNLKHAPPANAPSMTNEPSEKFEILLGQPRLIVSITNSPDDVFQGFLELVGPPEVGATKF